MVSFFLVLILFLSCFFLLLCSDFLCFPFIATENFWFSFLVMGVSGFFSPSNHFKKDHRSINLFSWYSNRLSLLPFFRSLLSTTNELKLYTMVIFFILLSFCLNYLFAYFLYRFILHWFVTHEILTQRNRVRSPTHLPIWVDKNG